jgi:eukaryotic-like serine/threonine-protein kinase
VFVSPANKNLRDTLVRLHLCSDRDFRRSRRIVRKLARGIPAFDFVWIDALVQLGSLTPYQAKVLQSAQPEQLCIGPCVLLERLGSGNDSATYRARGPQGETLALKRLHTLGDELPHIAARLRDAIEKTRGFESPHVVAPHALIEQAGGLVVLSGFRYGLTCKELLVRRGRFAPEIVAEIGRQLAHGCASLEARTLLHGQIRLDNVRITSAGNAVLVDAGIGCALDKGVLIRDDIPPDAYDAIAPERIGTGSPLTTASEIYAFGCLLWQMLAGRPPFPTADPLAKLAAHQSRGVPDVRTIAPDTPANLAEAVRACTHPDPDQRPATFAAIARRFGTPTPSGGQRLARFLRRFDGAAPSDQLTPERPTRFPTAAVALLLFVLSGAALFLVRHGATAELLRVGNGRPLPAGTATSDSAGDPSPQFASPARTVEAPRGRTADFTQPLPPPNADGVIELAEGPYEAETIHCVGDLLIRGKGAKPATILVDDRPLQLGCRKLALERVIVRCVPRRNSAAPSSADALVQVRSQELAIGDCAFVSASDRAGPGRSALDRSEESVAAIVWTAAPARDPDAGRIRLTNTVFATSRTALRCASPPSRIEIDNCLKLGGGMLDFDERSAGRDISVVAQHVTLRQASWLCCLARGPKVANGQLHLVLRDSVFDLAGRGAALIRVVSPTQPSGRGRAVLITGSDSVIRPEVPIVGWSKPGTDAVTPVDARGLSVEGLAVGDFQFVAATPAAGADSASSLAQAAASAIDLRSLAIPRNSDEPPGFVASRLAGGFQSARR